MNIQEREKIESRLAEINREIRSLGPIMRGSVTLMGKRNKQPYFSVTVKRRGIWLRMNRILNTFPLTS